MKAGLVQCKDIADLDILQFLKDCKGFPCNWYEDSKNSVRLAMPPNTPTRLILAKMKSLIRRGLVDGCSCGCRGDFRITAKGLGVVTATMET